MSTIRNYPGQKMLELLERTEGLIQLTELGITICRTEKNKSELNELNRRKEKLKKGLVGRLCFLERRQYTSVLNEITSETLDVYDACLNEKIFLFDYTKTRYPEIAVEYLKKTGQL